MVTNPRGCGSCRARLVAVGTLDSRGDPSLCPACVWGCWGRSCLQLALLAGRAHNSWVSVPAEASSETSGLGALFEPREPSLAVLGPWPLLRLPVLSPGHGERSAPAHPGHLLADPVGPCQPHQQGHAHPPSGVSPAWPSSTFWGWAGCSLPSPIPGNCPGTGMWLLSAAGRLEKWSGGKVLGKGGEFLPVFL